MEKICLLEECNNLARKKFCCNKHKDRYHNKHNPRGMYAHLSRKSDHEYASEEAEMGWDGHKDTF
jgi:hypothetical protein